MKVIVDTNVVVSANLSDQGPSAAILDLAANKLIVMFVSPAILVEYEEVLRRPRLRLDSTRITRSLAVIRRTSRLVTPTRHITASADESDNRFLECAVAAGADFIITGNVRHFPRHFEGIRIVTPRAFVDLISPELAGGR